VDKYHSDIQLTSFKLVHNGSHTQTSVLSTSLSTSGGYHYRWAIMQPALHLNNYVHHASVILKQLNFFSCTHIMTNNSCGKITNRVYNKTSYSIMSPPTSKTLYQLASIGQAYPATQLASNWPTLNAPSYQQPNHPGVETTSVHIDLPVLEPNCWGVSTNHQ